jgi:hypothetical protein
VTDYKTFFPKPGDRRFSQQFVTAKGRQEKLYFHFNKRNANNTVLFEKNRQWQAGTFQQTGRAGIKPSRELGRINKPGGAAVPFFHYNAFLADQHFVDTSCDQGKLSYRTCFQEGENSPFEILLTREKNPIPA